MAAMIRVHHLENSRSQRILWLLEELGLTYEVRHYSRNKRTMLAPPELRRVHPLGKAPVIEDLEARGGAGRIVAESGAIVEYLVEKADGRLGPPANREAILLYRQFLHYAEGSMMPPLLAMLVVRRLGLLGRPARAPLQRMLDAHLDWLEAELGERDWVARDGFTAPAAMMRLPPRASRPPPPAPPRAGLDGSRPNLIAWLDRIHARPAYREALRKGGPYAFA